MAMCYLTYKMPSFTNTSKAMFKYFRKRKAKKLFNNQILTLRDIFREHYYQALRELLTELEGDDYELINDFASNSVLFYYLLMFWMGALSSISTNYKVQGYTLSDTEEPFDYSLFCVNQAINSIYVLVQGGIPMNDEQLAGMQKYCLDNARLYVDRLQEGNQETVSALGYTYGLLLSNDELVSATEVLKTALKKAANESLQ
ncbi:hypothetical protein VCHA41O245_20290 [Vibrio chagasii]|nr:hypothetical protein VCHA41O245_20290 [Vibrio chagasii]